VNTAPVTWTNQPAALTELAGSTARRLKVDITLATQVRLTVNVTRAGAAGATLLAQYSLDGSSWQALGTPVAINTTGTLAGAWQTVPSAARRDVFLRVAGQGGDGAADPIIGTVIVQVR